MDNHPPITPTIGYSQCEVSAASNVPLRLLRNTDICSGYTEAGKKLNLSLNR